MWVNNGDGSGLYWDTRTTGTESDAAVGAARFQGVIAGPPPADPRACARSAVAELERMLRSHGQSCHVDTPHACLPIQTVRRGAHE